MSTLEVDPKLEAEQARRVAYVAMLRAIAELTEVSAIPVADSVSLAWHVDHDDARKIAAELGGEWKPSEDSRDGSGVANGQLVAGAFPFSPLVSATLFVAPAEPVGGQRDRASRLLVADLNASIVAARRAQLEVIEGSTPERTPR